MTSPKGRIFALVGTVLTGFPLAAPIVLAVIARVAGGGLLLDFLLPGELIIVVAAGGASLLTAALIARRRRLAIAMLVGAAVLSFGLTSLFAIVTGLASGAIAAEGWPLAVVIGAYALYIAAVVALFVAGVALTRDLFRIAREARSRPTPPPS